MRKLFSFGKKKDIQEQPDVQFSKQDVAETSATPDSGANASQPTDKNYVEMLFPVPGIQAAPMDWCRDYVVDRVASDIKDKVFKQITIFIVLIVISVCLGFASYSLNEWSDKRITASTSDTKVALDKYSDEIKSAMNLNSVLDYVPRLGMEAQIKGITKVMVESGIVCHSVKFNHVTSDIPDNIKNNFETAASSKLDDVEIVGVWYIDGTFINVAPDAQPANENWMLDVNQKLKKLYVNDKVNVYLDISSTKLSSRDNQNRNEFVIVFWR